MDGVNTTCPGFRLIYRKVLILDKGEKQMALVLFSFAINPETQEAAFAGNMEPQVALQILQQLVIAEAIRKAREVKPDGKSKDVSSV